MERATPTGRMEAVLRSTPNRGTTEATTSEVVSGVWHLVKGVSAGASVTFGLTSTTNNSPPLPSQLQVVATRPTVVMEAMAEAAMEGAAMATSREAGAMEGAAMARTEGAVVMEVVGDMVATEGVAMEAMAVEEVQDVMMTVSVLVGCLLVLKRSICLVQAGSLHSLSFSRLLLQGMVARATAVPCAPSTRRPITHTPTTVISAKKRRTCNAIFVFC